MTTVSGVAAWLLAIGHDAAFWFGVLVWVHVIPFSAFALYAALKKEPFSWGLGRLRMFEQLAVACMIYSMLVWARDGFAL